MQRPASGQIYSLHVHSGEQSKLIQIASRTDWLIDALIDGLTDEALTENENRVEATEAKELKK